MKLAPRNPYDGSIIEFSEEDWDRILGKWTNTQVTKAEADELWKTLCFLDPFKTDGNMHVEQYFYMHEGIRYECVWSHEQLFDEPPTLMHIQTPRKRISPVQQELFPK